jgi:hypothetical protein
MLLTKTWVRDIYLYELTVKRYNAINIIHIGIRVTMGSYHGNNIVKGWIKAPQKYWIHLTKSYEVFVTYVPTDRPLNVKA